MMRSTYQTQPLTAAVLQRLVTAVMLAMLLAAASAQVELGFTDMYENEDPQEFSETLLAADGETVRFRGYAATPLEADANYFVLTRYPMGVCPFCESEAEWPPDIVYIKLPRRGTDTILFGGLAVTGTLELGTEKDPESGFVSRVRIQAERIERAN